MNFLTSCGTVSVVRRAVLHGVFTIRECRCFPGQRIAIVETGTALGIYYGRINGSNYVKSVHEKPAGNLSYISGVVLGSGPYRAMQLAKVPAKNDTRFTSGE